MPVGAGADQRDIRAFDSSARIVLAACLAAAAMLAAALGHGDGLARADGPWVPSSQKPVTIVWAVGDGADGGSAADRVVDMLGRHPFDRLLYLGDVYETGTAQEFAQRYAPTYGRFAARTAPTIGNHEWDNRATGYLPYWQGVRGTPPPLYYQFRASGWQILSLDSEADHDAGSAQAGWLQDQLAATPELGNCRIAFWHRPRFSAGAHGDAPDMDSLWRQLDGEARVAIWGHDHDMQRLHARQGIVPMVSGAGGRSLYPVDETDPRLAFADDTHRGALRLRLSRNRLRWRFVGTPGGTLDSGELGCHRQ